MPAVIRRAERRQVERSLRRRAPAGDLPDPSRDPGEEIWPQIRHVVVVMMENHSYDNLLGTLDRPGVLPDERFTMDASGRPTNDNPSGSGARVRVRHRQATTQDCGMPHQSWHASHLQRGEGACDGFVTSEEEVAAPGSDTTVGMSYWTEAELPFYHDLARTFPLAPRWFCSCLGPTFPNRRFLISGTAHGLIDDLPFGMLDYPEAGTIFDQLTRHGITWTNYYPIRKVRLVLSRLLGRPGLRTFRALGLLLVRLLPWLTRYVLGNLHFTADLYPLGALGALNHLRSIDRFWTDAAEGTLPQVSIVDPSFTCYSEESPQDVQCGESFAAEVIRAVMRGRGWANTLLIWTYDEHGGYYDHVDPPEAVEPDGVRGHSLLTWAGAFGWLLRRFGLWRRLDRVDAGPSTYDRLGFRVPAVIVSPYARRDLVMHETYDHTSILALIERKWNLPYLTERDRGAADPMDALDLEAQTPPFLVPPDLSAPARPWAEVQVDPCGRCRPRC